MSKDDEVYFNFLNMLEPHFGMSTTLLDALRDMTTEEMTADLLLARDNKSADGKKHTGIRFYLFNDAGVMLEHACVLERLYFMFAMPETIRLRLERIPERMLECTSIVAIGNKKIVAYRIPHGKNILDLIQELDARRAGQQELRQQLAQTIQE